MTCDISRDSIHAFILLEESEDSQHLTGARDKEWLSHRGWLSPVVAALAVHLARDGRFFRFLRPSLV